MNSFISSMNGFIGSIISSFIISLLFFIIQLYNKKRLSYYIGNNCINNISTTDIIIWNNGRYTLYYDSTYSGRHTPKIKWCNSDSIIDITILESTFEDIDITQRENNLAVLDFNKMRPRDCFITRIQHTGHNNNCIKIDFELNNFNIKKYNSLKRISNRNYIYKYVFYIILLILFLKFSISAFIAHKDMMTTIDTWVGPIIVTVYPFYQILCNLRQIYLSFNIPDILQTYLSKTIN